MMNDIQILIGDVRKTLKDVPDNSVNCCVTSPPYYGLRSYIPDDADYKDAEIGMEQTPEEFIQNLVEVFREVKRVLTNDGVCYINIADSYCGTGDKGNWTDPKYPEGRNGQRVSKNRKIEGIKSKDLIGIPWMLAFALRADGWFWRDTVIWAKACSGVYSGGSVLPESVVDRTCRGHEYILMFTKKAKYFYNKDAIAEKQSASSLKRAFSNNNMDARKGKGDEQYAISGKSQDKCYAKARAKIEAGEEMTRNRRSVWTVNLRPSAVGHFAAYPAELVEPCILSGCPDNGVVLDPFGGTGTTAVMATLLGRKAIHCDLDPRTSDFIEERKREIIKQRNSDGETITNGKIVKARKLF